MGRDKFNVGVREPFVNLPRPPPFHSWLALCRVC